MSSNNSEFPFQSSKEHSSNNKPKKHPRKKNYFNTSSKKYQSDEKDITSPKKIIYHPKMKESPENGDEYKELKYSGQIYTPHNLDKANYYNEKEKSDEFNNFRTKWKTEICKYWEMHGECKYGKNCAFAHGDSELKQRKLSFNYKTKPCKQFFELGVCSYGMRCQFSHKKDDYIKQQNELGIIDNSNNKISYLKIIKEFLSDENNNISHELIRRPRLRTFENIANCSLLESVNSKLKLYEDIINIKNEKLFRKKYSDDSYYTNFSSDNNENINDNRDYY